MLDNNGATGEEALRTGEGSGKGLGTDNGASPHTHDLEFFNNSTSGLQNRATCMKLVMFHHHIILSFSS